MAGVVLENGGSGLVRSQGFDANKVSMTMWTEVWAGVIRNYLTTLPTQIEAKFAFTGSDDDTFCSSFWLSLLSGLTIEQIFGEPEPFLHIHVCLLDCVRCERN